jgi:hypothetical protein
MPRVCPTAKTAARQGWMTHFFSTGNGAATLLLDPTVARDVASHGYASKEAFSQWLSNNTKTPSWLYWQTHPKEMKQGQEGVEPYASYLKMGAAELPEQRFWRRSRPGAPAPPKPTSSVEVVVLGGETNTYWMGGDFSYTASASVDKWR